jgi:hypothetical protein
MAATPHDDLLSVYTAYLDERGYQAARIPEATTRTPDLEVSGHENSFLNEFKSPDLLLDQALGLYKFTTTNSKLLQFIHTALKQFKAYDPSHCRPWVITFASVNFQLNWHTLSEAMYGGSVVEGRVMADWTRTAVFQRWTKDRYVADLYIWLQVNDQTMEPYQASFVTNKLSAHRPLVDELVANLRAAPLSNMDTNWLLV